MANPAFGEIWDDEEDEIIRLYYHDYINDKPGKYTAQQTQQVLFRRGFQRSVQSIRARARKLLRLHRAFELSHQLVEPTPVERLANHLPWR